MDESMAMRELRELVAERDWEQFHSPENLAKSIAIEAGELLRLPVSAHSRSLPNHPRPRPGTSPPSTTRRTPGAVNHCTPHTGTDCM